MSAENNEFPIPFEESRRGSFSDIEKKAAAKRLGSYLASRAINRPSIGDMRGGRRRRGINVDLPTGGKPGTRKPTGTSRDPDNDGWVDEGTTRPRWVGIDGQPGQNRRQTGRQAESRDSLSSGGTDYRGQHSAPERDGGAPLHDLAQVYPDDIYSRSALRNYGTGEDELDREAYAFFLSVRGKPDAPVTIYRAVPKSTKQRIDEIKKEQSYILRTGRTPKGARPNYHVSDYYELISAELLRLEEEGLAETPQINPGDWVTPFRKYAESHGNSALNGDYEIVSKRVRAKDIFTDGNSWLEWGYDPSDNPKPRGETPDGMTTLSSGRKYQEFVDKQPDVPDSKKNTIRQILDELQNPELTNADRYKREEDPFGDMVRVIDNSPETLASKKKIYDLVKSLFEGNIETDRDIVVADKNGNDVNLGKTVRVVPRDVHRMQSNAYGVEIRDENGLKLYVSTTLSLRPSKDASRSLIPGDNAPDSMVPWDGLPGDDRTDNLMLGSAVRTLVFDLSGDGEPENNVMHNTFSVSEDAQGFGIGSAFNARNEKLYEELGIDSIYTSGGSGIGQNGAVHWPKNGFTWADESSKLRFLRIIDSALRNEPDKYSNDEERKRISSLIKKTGDTNRELDTSSSAEELLKFSGAEKLFADKEAIIDYRRELQGSRRRQLVLSSGSGQNYSREGIFSRRSDEQADVSEGLSSGRKYQEIVDSQPELSEDKKRLASEFSKELMSSELQREDTYVPYGGPQPPRRPGSPEPKPRLVIQDSEQRAEEKSRVRDLLARVFDGEITLEKDIIIKGEDGTELNIGNRVLVEALPQSSYSPAIKIHSASEQDIKERDELQLYDNIIDDGDLIAEIGLTFRIKPLPKFNDAVVALFSDEDKKRYLWDDGTPSIARADRTFMRIFSGEKDIRVISHDAFYIHPIAQGKGLGSSFNARNEQIYKELDVRSIFTWGASGGGSTGAVHWPKNGFLWGGESQKQKFIATIDNAIKTRPELFSEDDKNKIASLYGETRDGLWETRATAEELLDFPAADEVFSDANSQFFYVRPLKELAKELYRENNLRQEALSSGKSPSYPREPTYGAFIGKANDIFNGVRSWKEFRDRYNDQEVVFFDYETTGLVFDEFRQPLSKGAPVQFGAVKIKNGREVGRINLFMNPNEELGEWSRNNLKDRDGNPLTDEWLAQQMSIEEAHRQLIEFAGQDAIFGVQNASFDKDVLDGVLKQMGETWKPGGWIDTRELAGLVLPRWTPETDDGPFVTDRDGTKKPSSSLAAITEYLGVELGDGHHNADVDAFATSEVMRKMIDGAIENGWSTDALDKSKRDSILKQSQDKFSADVAQFEKSKKEYLDGLSSGARVADTFVNTPSSEWGTRDDVIESVGKALGVELTSEQYDIVSSIIPWAIATIDDKTLLDIEPSEPFRDTGRRLLESLEVRISSDGIPFISGDPIPQIAEQIPDKRDWRTIELPPANVITEILSTAREDHVLFREEEGVWVDLNNKIVARVVQGAAGEPDVLQFEDDNAASRFPLLKAIAPNGVIRAGQSVNLSNLVNDKLPGIYGEAWKKHGAFLEVLAQRAGELIGDKSVFDLSNANPTQSFINGYVGGIANPKLFNMSRGGSALQQYHDLFGHLGTGRGFDRHGEWANDLAMMSIVDHPDSPLSDIEKMAVKHTIFRIYASKKISRGRRDDFQDEISAIQSDFTAARNNEATSIGGFSVRDGSAYAGDLNKIIERLRDASTTRKLSSGAKKLPEADRETAITALTLDALGLAERNSDISGESLNLSSGRERPIIPMRPATRPVFNAPESGYGKLDSSGKPIRRTTNTWLKGMTASEMAELLVPQSAEQIFEMWADDMAPLWRDKPDWEKALRQYFDEFYNEDKTIELDFSPESIEEMRSVLTQSIESSPGFKWLIENHGAPIIGIFSRDASLADAEIPRVRENYERLMKERGWTVLPFTKGRSISALEMIGLHPRLVLDKEAQGARGQTVPARLLMDPDRKLESFDAHIDSSIQAVIIHEYGHWLHRRALRNSETTPDARTRSYYGSGDSNDVLYLKGIDVAIEYDSIKRDNKRIKIHSDLISSARQSPETVFRIYPDIPLMATSYGNVNKYESIAEGLVAILHPNKEIRDRTVNKKLRSDILSLLGIDGDSELPWHFDRGQPSPAGEKPQNTPTPTSARLSSGASSATVNQNTPGGRIGNLKSLEPQEIISIAVDNSKRTDGGSDISVSPIANPFTPPRASSSVPNETEMMIEESVDRAFAQKRQNQMGVENYKMEAARFKRMVALDITDRMDIQLSDIFEAFSMIDDDVFGAIGSDNQYLLERISPIHPVLLRTIKIAEAIDDNRDEYTDGVTSSRLTRETISITDRRNAGLFGVSAKGEVVGPEVALFSVTETKRKIDFINAATELIDELEVHDAARFGSVTPPLFKSLYHNKDESMEERINRAVANKNLSPQDKMLRALVFMATQAESDDELLSMTTSAIIKALERFMFKDLDRVSLLNVLEDGRTYLGSILSSVAKHSTRHKQYMEATLRRPFGETAYVGIPRVRRADKMFEIIDADLIPFNPEKGIGQQLPYGMEAAKYLVHLMPFGFFQSHWVHDINSPSFEKLNEDKRKFNEALVAYSTALRMPMDKLIARLEELNKNGGIELIDSGNVSGVTELKSVIPTYFKSMQGIDADVLEQQPFDRSLIVDGKAQVGDYTLYDIRTPNGKRQAISLIVSDIVHSWAISSNDKNPLMLAIQHEARQMFGLEAADGWNAGARNSVVASQMTNGAEEAIKISARTRWEGPAEDVDDSPRLSEAQAKIVRAVLQAMYDSTQEYYRSKGITHVPVWRGLTSEPIPQSELSTEGLPISVATMRPLSSWSYSPEVARTFSGQNNGIAPWDLPQVNLVEEYGEISVIEPGIITDNASLMKAFVPVEQILSNAYTGFGCLEERELVILGRPTVVGQITAPPSGAFSFSSANEQLEMMDEIIQRVEQIEDSDTRERVEREARLEEIRDFVEQQARLRDQYERLIQLNIEELRQSVDAIIKKGKAA